MDPNQSSSGAGDAYFGDAEGPAEPGDSPQEESSENDSATGLLPTSFFQGKDLKPGSRCEVEIARVHDDQVEVKYVSHSQDEEMAEPAPTPNGSESEGMSEDMMG